MMDDRNQIEMVKDTLVVFLERLPPAPESPEDNYVRLRAVFGGRHYASPPLCLDDWKFEAAWKAQLEYAMESILRAQAADVARGVVAELTDSQEYAWSACEYWARQPPLDPQHPQEAS